MKRAAVVLCALALTGAAASKGENEAKGTLTYEAKSGPVVVTVKHAYLFKGPDVVSGAKIRRLVLSTVDVSAKLKACQTMMCSDGGIGEGMTVDFDAGRRLNYWFVANGQLVQYSGTAELTADAPDRLAGALNLDGRKSGGPLVQVEFDARLVKEVKK
jgi:hypothetical protein